MNAYSNANSDANFSKWFTVRSTIIGGLSGLLFSLAQKQFSGEQVVAPFIVTMICLLLSLNDTVWGKFTASKLSKSDNAIKQTFKPTSTAGYTAVDELIGTASDAATQQAGSRFLQKALMDKDPNFSLVFPELLANLDQLATDMFGNYLIQSMIEHCSAKQRAALLHRLTANIGTYSCHQFGVRCIQTLIDSCQADPVASASIVQSLRGNINLLSRDAFGNHVIQRVLKSTPFDQCAFVADELMTELIPNSRNPYGCCVIQLVMERCSPKQLQSIIDTMRPETTRLAQCPYGNYVLQHILQLKNPDCTNALVTAMKGRMAELSAHKFSSNVIEKCLQLAPKPMCDVVILELIASPKFGALMTDPFGNYVIQKAMAVAQDDTLASLMAAIRPLVDKLRTAQYGRRIYNRFYKHERIRTEEPAI